jgi:hypothetical protein
MENGRDDMWSIWESASNRSDTLANIGNNSASVSTPLFYYATNPNNFAPPINIAATTFTVQPFSLANQSINDSSEISQAMSFVGTLDSNVDTGSKVTIMQGEAMASHYYGTSGALTISGAAQPFNVSQQVAQSGAVAFLNATLGLPSDAVLTTTLAFDEADPATGSVIQTDWEFIWHHSSPLLGGDAIKVLVDAKQTATTTCTGGTETVLGPRGEPITICLKSTTTFTYTPNIAYHYRQWRTMSSRRTTLSNGQPANSPQSIDALTASASLPLGVPCGVSAYTSGYWTDGMYTSTSTDGAIPAWIFTAGGQNLGVDAVTGQFLGSSL